MCTMIIEKVGIEGSAKGPAGWFTVDRAYVAYDHPVHVDLEHALNLDFVDETAGPSARVAVELTRDAARRLAEQILTTLDAADHYEAGVR